MTADFTRWLQTTSIFARNPIWILLGLFALLLFLFCVAYILLTDKKDLLHQFFSAGCQIGLIITGVLSILCILVLALLATHI